MNFYGTSWRMISLLDSIHTRKRSEMRLIYSPNWKASTAPPPATNDRSRRTPGAPPAIAFAGGETRCPGDSTVRRPWAELVPLPANDAALAGFDPTRPTSAP